jgi:tripartite-type tricarboxylate transporter receptor subunit TctC
MLLTAANLVTSPGLYARVPFDPVRDFAPVSQLAQSPNVFIVHPSFGARTMKELIDTAKAKPDRLWVLGSCLHAASGGRVAQFHGVDQTRTHRLQGWRPGTD